MTQLSDTQSILLARASQREDGSVYPLPDTITAPAAGVAKSIASLIRRGLARELETSDADTVTRYNGDLRYGIFITDSGRAAIGIDFDIDTDIDIANNGDAIAPAPPLQQRHRIGPKQRWSWGYCSAKAARPWPR